MPNLTLSVSKLSLMAVVASSAVVVPVAVVSSNTSVRSSAAADTVTVVSGSPSLFSSATRHLSTSPSPVVPPVTGVAGVLGVNVASVSYYSTERSFANLLRGSGWLDPGIAGWGALDGARIDPATGNVISLAADQTANLILTPPAGAYVGAGVTIRCTWTGTGEVVIQGSKTHDVPSNHSWEFFWPVAQPGAQRVWLELHRTDPADPIRNLDCREKTLDSNALFAPEFVASLDSFKVLRFLDWEGGVNDNKTFSWAQRTKPAALTQAGGNGVAIEHMLTLAKKVGADPWLNIPWNADADYVTHMAKLVHDSLPASSHVYVEMSNEVWNYADPVTTQAQQEGLAEGLSTNAFEAALRRYGEKTSWAMKIWAKVFADRPGQLVRVAATQSQNPWTARTVLGYADTAANIDALAIAPYFGQDLLNGGPLAASMDTNALLAELGREASVVLTNDAQGNKAVANQYGKRLLAYEAGQHIISNSNVTMVAALNRDSRMYDIYKAYLANWKASIGDTMVLFSSTGTISQYGAWGLREYAGQPLQQSPKRRAALDASAVTQ